MSAFQRAVRRKATRKAKREQRRTTMLVINCRFQMQMTESSGTDNLLRRCSRKVVIVGNNWRQDKNPRCLQRFVCQTKRWRCCLSETKRCRHLSKLLEQAVLPDSQNHNLPYKGNIEGLIGKALTSRISHILSSQPPPGPTSQPPFGPSSWRVMTSDVVLCGRLRSGLPILPSGQYLVASCHDDDVRRRRFLFFTSGVFGLCCVTGSGSLGPWWWWWTRWRLWSVIASWIFNTTSSFAWQHYWHAKDDVVKLTTNLVLLVVLTSSKRKLGCHYCGKTNHASAVIAFVDWSCSYATHDVLA